MPEKINFDFSKIRDQKKFAKLDDQKKEEIVGNAQDKSSVMQDLISRNEVNGYDEALERAEEGEVLAGLIDLPRVNIVNEDEDSFLIMFGDEKIKIVKGEDSCFYDTSSELSSGRMVLAQTCRQLPMSGVFQDRNAPREFMEVMMFHELKEKEYKDFGFENHHNRAVNDEILYVLKYFSEKDRRAYFKFARDFRENPMKIQKKEQNKENRGRLIEERKKKRELKEENDKKLKYNKIVEHRREMKIQMARNLGVPEKYKKMEQLDILESLDLLSENLFDYVNEDLGPFLFCISKNEQESLYKKTGDNWIYEIFKKIVKEIEMLCDGGELYKDTDTVYKVKLSKQEATVLLAKIDVFLDLFQ